MEKQNSDTYFPSGKYLQYIVVDTSTFLGKIINCPNVQSVKISYPTLEINFVDIHNKKQQIVLYSTDWLYLRTSPHNKTSFIDSKVNDDFFQKHITSLSNITLKV